MKRLLPALSVSLFLAASSFAQLVSEKKDWWSIKVSYPTFLNRSATAGAANQLCRRLEKSVFEGFLAEAKRDLPDIKKMHSAGQYELLVIPTKTMDSAALCSGYTTNYRYTAGAHGTTTYTVLNIGIGGAALSLRDLFIPGVDGARECSFSILAHFLKTGEASSVQSGEWTQLTPEQARRFVVTPDGLLFLFDQYELGASAEGTFKVLVPFASLHGLKPREQWTAQPTLEGVVWVLESIQMNDDTTLKPEPGGRYELIFGSDGKVSGVAGRNRLGGPFTKGVDGSLKMESLFSTLMADPANSIAGRYRNLLAEVTRFQLKDGKLVLELKLDTGVMVFRRG